ncbi:MAG TPA: CRISPR-associated helicase Cas3' [Acidobacteriota bacterium]|nr:CRISPR-associated helicase Cas3' [Acidobacteriota bacterium]
MNFKSLLAKSPPKDPTRQSSGTLVGHITAVMRATQVLCEVLGPTIVQAFDLEQLGVERFSRTALLGAFLHDWGKANHHFQIMVRLKSLDQCVDQDERKIQIRLHDTWTGIGTLQMLRHEILSGVLAYSVPSFQTWLRQCPNVDFEAALWAAIGHHLKIGGKNGSPTNQIAELRDGTGKELWVYADHQDFTNLLRFGVSKLNLPNDLPERPKVIWKKYELAEALENLREVFIEYELSDALSDERQRFIAAVKATVLAADVAGSALPNARENGQPINIEKWCRKVLQQVLTVEELETLVQKRLKGQSLRPFQQTIAQSQSRITLVRAGCGAGKTVAAYAWGKQVAVGKKIFFGYPTTGTASQGFIDYAASNSFESRLMHGRAEIDRELLVEDVLHTNEDQHEPSGEKAESLDSRLASLEAWPNKLIVCTVDTVLGLIQNNRRPLYSWPALCQSAFVFDEVHAYDNQLFGALLRFLETFRKTPILLMSASFSESQLHAIQALVEIKLGESLEIIDGPQNLEKIQRYQIQVLNTQDSAWDEIEQTLKEGSKVLWVTNIVSDTRNNKVGCIDIFREACQRLAPLGIRPLIYHSRFRYEDRVQKHKDLVNAFAGEGPVFAVTTQVCELSLDLSATLLVTASAPAAALIQRFGRLNRKVEELPNGQIRLRSGKVCPALVYPWKFEFPYEAEELATGTQLLDCLPSGPISQMDLAVVAAGLESQPVGPVTSSWLDKNWRSFPTSLREAGNTLTVLLEEDLPAIRQAVREKNVPLSVEAQRWTVPITILKDSIHWQREGVYPIAPKGLIVYSKETGAEICKQNQKSNSTLVIL